MLIRKCGICVYFSIVSIFLTGYDVLFMNRVVNVANEGNKLPMIIVGTVFWSSIVATYLGIYKADRYRKEAIRCGYGEKVEGKIGVFRFFSRKEAIVVDFLMVVSFAVCILSEALRLNNRVSLIGISSTIVFIQLHGVFNGKNYYFYKKYKKEE